MDGRRQTCALLIAGTAVLAACGGSEAREEPSQASVAPPPSSPSAPAAPAPAPDPSLPASKRIQGKWLVNLKPVSRAALKQTGLNPKSRIEYTIDDSEFILDNYGSAGRNRVRWHYEIVSESGDDLVLRKVDGSEAPQEANVKVHGNSLLISREGETPLQLERID